MDTDLIERLAREAGLIEMDHDCIEGVPLEKLPALSALIAEECAKVANEYDTVDDAIAAIRAKFAPGQFGASSISSEAYKAEQRQKNEAARAMLDRLSASSSDAPPPTDPPAGSGSR